MPHGGGHHGGGGFGGGHHHGGFHHHHHHHHGGFRHHHHHRSGLGLYYSNGPYWYYRRRPLSWVFFSIFFTVAIIVGTSVTIRYTASDDYYNNDNSLLYSPIDTRLVSVSNSLCQSLKLEVGILGDYGYLATLYMLDSPPKLTGQDTFSFSDQPSFTYSQDYKYYYYYLHPGSDFTMSACLTDASSSVTFYLFKGHRRFNNWRDNEYSTHYKKKMLISKMCSSGNQTSSYTVGSNAEDYYYLVFDATYVSIYNGVNITVNFHRTLYEVSNSSIVQSCSVNSGNSYSSCSVGVPLSGHTAYLAVQPRPGTTIDWTDGIDVSSICGARIWMYVIISVSVLIGVAGILLTVVVLCVCMYKKKKQKTAINVTNNATEEPVAPLLSDQPPVNPSYHPETGGTTYGSNMDPPPAYNYKA